LKGAGGLKRPAYDEKTKNDDLIALMNAADLPIRDKMTKAELIAALDEFYDGQLRGQTVGDEGTDEDDGEGPPVLGAEGAVV
jgi:hypothetical protein